MKYAGFWRQLLAVVIDQLVVLLPGTLIPSAYYYAAVANGATQNAADYQKMVFQATLTLVLFGIYYVVLNGHYGVTLGRRLMNLKLVRLDQPNRDGIGYGKAAVRLMLFAVASGFVRLSAIVGVPPIIAVVVDSLGGATVLWLLFDSRRRTVEDTIVNTAIVHDPLGKFPDFDPDKLPTSKSRPYTMGALIVLNVLASLFMLMNR
jgi:uncharacterized RDD family membrane protein YckC